MRIPVPEILADPLLKSARQGCCPFVDGQKIRGRLLSCRDRFLTLDPGKGARITPNKYAVASIQADSRH